MRYRTLPHGGEEISILGMGTGEIGSQSEEEIIATVHAALDAGINFFDMAGAKAAIFPAFGKALSTRREKVYLQLHFGADYTTGDYGWTTHLPTIRRSVAWQLQQLGRDSIDFAFLHCVDEEKDLQAHIDSGLVAYLRDLKARGTVRHIGLSSHAPELVNRVLDMELVDIVMFSINPLYDWGQGSYARGDSATRAALYARCEKEGVAISVMKPFSGGQLLDAALSPFHAALSTAQCIQYALDKPATVTVLPGVRHRRDLQDILTYLDAPADARDYSFIGAYTPDDALHRCVYCAHCHPCPAGLDIALINKYYDLAQLGDTLAQTHYLTLTATAQACLQCGHCNDRCPFRVDQMARMAEISAYFGR